MGCGEAVVSSPFGENGSIRQELAFGCKVDEGIKTGLEK
jgi:hypothetical protein